MSAIISVQAATKIRKLAFATPVATKATAMAIIGMQQAIIIQKWL
jgi:hypothetical protein